jgi:hypothetical protein
MLGIISKYEYNTSIGSESPLMPILSLVLRINRNLADRTYGRDDSVHKYFSTF